MIKEDVNRGCCALYEPDNEFQTLYFMIFSIINSLPLTKEFSIEAVNQSGFAVIELQNMVKLKSKLST